MREAARRGDLQRVRGLLSSGQACSSAKDKKGNTALHFAAASGRVDIIQVLLRAAADKNAVDRKERTPLHIAAENGHVASMEALLAAGAEPRIRAGKDECSILDFAVIRGHLGILRGKKLQQTRACGLATTDPWPEYPSTLCCCACLLQRR